MTILENICFCIIGVKSPELTLLVDISEVQKLTRQKKLFSNCGRW